MADGVQRHVGLQFVYRRLFCAAVEEASRLMAFDLLLDAEDVDVALPLLLLATRRFEMRQAQEQINHILAAELFQNKCTGSTRHEELLNQLACRYPALRGCVPDILQWYSASSRFTLVDTLLMRRGFAGEQDQFGAVRVRSTRALGVVREPATLYAFTTPMERRRRYAAYWPACERFYRDAEKEEERSYTGWPQGLVTRPDVPAGAATRVWAAGPGAFLLLHCPGRFLPAFQRHLRALYPRVLSMVDPTDFRDVCTGVALLHYWLTQATLYKRGSASIAEMFALALFRAFQQSSALSGASNAAPAWVAPDGFRAGWMPDLEAFFRPKTDFVVRYPAWLAWAAPPPPPTNARRNSADTSEWLLDVDGGAADLQQPVAERWQALLAERMPLHHKLGQCRPKPAPPGPFWEQQCSHTWPPSKYDIYRADEAQLEQWQTIHQRLRNFRID
eukprot:EG_transcript_11902